MPKDDEVVECVAVRPFSLGAGKHVEAGKRFSATWVVMRELIGMGKAKQPTEPTEPTDDDGEPTISEPVATRRTKR